MHSTGTINHTGNQHIGPSSPDLSGYRALHLALRLAPRRLAQAVRTVRADDARRLEAIARYWKGYAGEVLAHHNAEDRVVFPGLVRAVPGTAVLITQTDDEHHRLDALMAEVATGVTALCGGEPLADEQLARSLDDLAHLMEVHLDFEDAEILPLVERHITVAEFDQMEKQILADLGIGLQAAFTVPFVISKMSAADRARSLATAPLLARLIYRLTRRRHARLEAAVFGNDAMELAS